MMTRKSNIDARELAAAVETPGPDGPRVYDPELVMRSFGNESHRPLTKWEIAVAKRYIARQGKR